MKLLLYCTKGKPNIVKGLDNEFYISNAWKSEGVYDFRLNGKIVGECDFEVERIKLETNSYEAWLATKTLSEEQLREKSCLRLDDLYNYLEPNNGYAIHIKNLHIFDKSKKLSEYSKRIGNDFQVLGNVPKNMMKCCELKYIIEDYILIPVSSQEMCRMANKEQTILVRKKVLKEMLKNA